MSWHVSFGLIIQNCFLLLQVGKFYELYEADADIGHRHLGLNFTHGGERDPNSKRMRCVGVPESKVEDTIAKLVPLGYKVGDGSKL
jgi:DNA mismatch repair ATPase MutS